MFYEKMLTRAAHIFITDLTGRKMFDKKIPLSTGRNSFILTDELAARIYLVEIRNKDFRNTIRWVKN